MHTPGPARPEQSLSVVHGLQALDCASHAGFAAVVQSALEAHSTQAPLAPQTGTDGCCVAHTLEPAAHGPQVPPIPQAGRSGGHWRSSVHSGGGTSTPPSPAAPPSG
jgi:hypothetical protein